jgi:hypothetical protein
VLTPTSTICNVLTSGLNAADIDYDILICRDQGIMMFSGFLLTPTLKSHSYPIPGIVLMQCDGQRTANGTGPTSVPELLISICKLERISIRLGNNRNKFWLVS